MNDDPNRVTTLEQEPDAAPRKTFRVWQLTETYRQLGLAPRAAVDAAVADLRLFFADDRRVQPEVVP